MFRKAMISMMLAATAVTPALAQPGVADDRDRPSWGDRQRGADGDRNSDRPRFEDRRGPDRGDDGRGRPGWADGRTDGDRGWDRGRGDGWGWNNGWRGDNRYDWQRYRQANRGFYRVPRYYAPQGGYRYNRFSSGYRIGAPFYDQRYWISDPFAYRLPPAHGPYRWVRYYDDVMLIDVRSGLVRDVIHDFFWR